MRGRRLLALMFVVSSAFPCAAVDHHLNQFVAKYCLDCHDRTTKESDLALDELLAADFAKQTDLWEKVVRKLTTRHMPPQGAPRPAEQDYQAVVTALTESLDRLAAAKPNVGRTETFRRLNRTEYQNAILDLLALEIDAALLLPADEASQGFDNITVSDLSPTLLARYVSAAQKISQRAVGRLAEPGEDVFRMRADVTQDGHLPRLPVGTRGGLAIDYNFPQDGEYEVQIRLMRDRNDEVESLREPHELEVSLDRERIKLFTVRPPAGEVTHQSVDANLKTRFSAAAGPRRLAIAFLPKGNSLLETTRQPLNVHFNFYRHPRLGPAVYQVSILGPFDAKGPGDTPSRRQIFVCRPTGAHDEEACARQIIKRLAARAYRRQPTDEQVAALMEYYRQGHADGGFEAGIELAIGAILVNPQFLFRIERDPPGAASGTVYRLDPHELASRLSFFLWSSLPDEELLALAESGELARPDVLERQVWRMLADERSRSLVTNFANQWLYLRNLDSAVPDMRLYPDFDDNLRQALRRETELLFESVLHEDRSVIDLLKSDHTFLNERLAKHYGIPHVFGSRMRKVALDEENQRGGLLRQGSVLTVTSYATRTSPVIRGKWVLETLLGTPPPPPPADVPALKDNTVASTLSVRERLAEHRRNEACSSCHNLMDPVGLALENFDAVGRWRTFEEGQRIDASGGLPGASKFVSVAGLENALFDRPELFVQALTEKLLTFALGRGVEPCDAPAVRQIVRDAKKDDYRFSQLILGIAHSTPFQMRRTP
jgi:hypothetical protein